MKVGSIVFATNSGLGILAKDFYDNDIITDTNYDTYFRFVNRHHFQYWLIYIYVHRYWILIIIITCIRKLIMYLYQFQ